LETTLASIKLKGILGLSTIYVGGEYEKVDISICSAEDMYEGKSLT
jgi:hypothetical protein